MTQPKTITVLYFAAASSATGIAQEEIPISNNFRLSDLPELLIARYPNTGLAKILSNSQWSVDLEMVEDVDHVILRGGEEVGVICPVSGG